MQFETKTEKNVEQAVPFFAVSNIEESVRYYVDGLGFEMTRKWIEEGKLRWCRLQHGGAALRNPQKLVRTNHFSVFVRRGSAPNFRRKATVPS